MTMRKSDRKKLNSIYETGPSGLFIIALPKACIPMYRMSAILTIANSVENFMLTFFGGGVDSSDLKKLSEGPNGLF